MSKIRLSDTGQLMTKELWENTSDQYLEAEDGGDNDFVFETDE